MTFISHCDSKICDLKFIKEQALNAILQADYFRMQKFWTYVSPSKSKLILLSFI